MRVPTLSAARLCVWMIIFIVGCIATPAFAQSEPAGCASATNVPTSNPVFCGAQVKAANGTVVNQYLGIPYVAQQPDAAGVGRWQTTTMATTLPASLTPQLKYGAPCIQGAAKLQSYMSEACLFLNVWAPANSTGPVPVMIFIHGGAFVEGSGGTQADVVNSVDLNTYNGANFAAQGLVIVTLNYRLGAFGFFGGTQPSGGNIAYNLGLRDQQNAINWVVNNIKLFGGDNTKITLFGESAGAMSTGLHTFSVPSNRSNNGTGPLSWQAAIMESNPYGSNYPNPTDPRLINTYGAFLASLCKQVYHPILRCSANQLATISSASYLQNSNNLTVAQILKAQTDAAKNLSGFELTGAFNLPWTPVIDTTAAYMPGFVTSQPWLGFQGKSSIPIAFGYNLNEGAVFAGMAMDVWEIRDSLPVEYPKELKDIFGASNESTIIGLNRYDPKQQSNLNPQTTGTSQALANLITDYAMWCGGAVAMNNVVNSGGTVYGYLFSEKPYSDIYNLAGDARWAGPDYGACEPAPPTSKITTFTPNVCHAGELAYVFNNLPAAADSKNDYEPQSNDTAIAQSMNQAWGNFALYAATNPSKLANWTPYTATTATGGGQVGQWINGQFAPSPTTINPVYWGTNGMCAFWSTMTPFNPNAPSPSTGKK